MRSAARRAKQISRYRHQRVIVDDEPVAAPDDPDEGREKIEVHVHVHRGASGQRTGKRAPAPPPRAELTGALFDWKSHYDRVCAPPAERKLSRWARLKTCQSCYEPVAMFAQRCARCSTPRSRRGFRMLFGLSALVVLAVTFGVFVHFFGAGAIAQRARASSPLREESEDDYYYEVVEVPVTPSPFGTTAAPSGGGAVVSTDHLSTH